MKWKIRLARDMAQEAFVVIEAPTGEQAETIFWQDMDPEVIHWSNDDVMGDREVIQICPADDKEALTPFAIPPAPTPENLRTYRIVWAIEVEADTPLSAARRARLCHTQPGPATYEVSEVCLCAIQRYGPRSRSTCPPTTTDCPPSTRLPRARSFDRKPALQSLRDYVTLAPTRSAR